jgi:hypothetical protein
MIFKLMSHSSGPALLGFAGIKGLVSQGDRVREFLEASTPSRILVSISPEEVEGLRSFLSDPFEMNLSDYEIIYGVLLSKFGEVMTQPPIYIEAMKYSVKSGVEIIGIDMDEQRFNEIYQNEISSTHLLRHSLRKKKLARNMSAGDDPYEFVEAWAREIGKLKGFARVDDRRAEHMAEVVREEMRKGYEHSVLIIDYELYGRFSMDITKEDWGSIQKYNS